MIKIIDAINDLKGDLNNSFKYQGDEDSLYYKPLSDIYVANNCGPSWKDEFICTTKDFNESVKECKNNFGAK